MHISEADYYFGVSDAELTHRRFHARPLAKFHKKFGISKSYRTGEVARGIEIASSRAVATLIWL
jgi:hypothetical protein